LDVVAHRAIQEPTGRKLASACKDNYPPAALMPRRQLQKS
jgi:hypothetical protein